jgi:4-diphosphocytidyl-2-C-methyl-D-erythritol kinase
MTWKAPAKVNLFLHVLNRRRDGYHDIFSLMQKISLCDELSFSPREAGVVLHCSDKTLPVDEKNLVVRAAQAVFEYCGYPFGVEIYLTKNIPMTAGLGGGSSDAATALKALNKIFSFGLTKEKLMRLGAKLGADVPFFLFGNKALASGIGDELRRAPAYPKLHFLLIKPPFELSTKMIYESFNLRLTTEKNNYSIPPVLALGDIIEKLHNDLESVSLKLYPELTFFKKMLLKNGALGALMSGSGPTVFGIYKSEKEAKQAQNVIEKKLRGKAKVFLAHSL